MSYVFGMSELCAQADGMALSAMVTNMFNMFVVLCTKHDILNVDNVRDVATVAAGLPAEIKNHAEKAMDVALDMKDATAFVIKPGSGNVQIRVSAYSGKVR